MSGRQNSDQEKLMMNYLLGNLPDAERSEVEERVFADDDFFAELLAAEDELFEKYFKGELAPGERAKFERHFLASPARRERLGRAKTLSRALKELPADQDFEAEPQPAATARPRRIFATRQTRRFAFAAAAVVIISSMSWLSWQRYSLSEEISRLEQESAARQEQTEEFARQNSEIEQRSRILAERLQAEQTLRAEAEEQTVELQRENERLKELSRENERAAAPVQRPNPPQTGSSVMGFLLTPGLTRALGEEKNLRLSSSVRTVVFNLDIPRGEYAEYQISLQTPEGREVFRREHLKARRSRDGSALAFPVPVRLLPAGVYILILNGKSAAGQTDLINQYAFNVVGK